MMQEINKKDKLYYTIDNLYDDYYLPEHDDEDHKRYIDRKTWKRIWNSFSKIAKRRLIEKGDFTLPGVLGKITIRKNKTKKRPINWAAFRKTGKLQFFENEHTDGHILKCQWIDRPFFNRNFLFNFELSRKIKSELSKAVKEDPSLLHKYDTLAKKVRK